MKENLTIKDVTPAVKSAVNAYLMARAYAETMREAVDKIEYQILAERKFLISPQHGKIRGEQRITDPRHLYLCEDDELLQWYYDEVDKRTKAAGLKPDDMQRDFCPAHVAEHEQQKTVWLILDCAAEMLKLDYDGAELNSQLLCRGLEEQRRFVDLVVGLVVNLPDYKNPLTEKAA